MTEGILEMPVEIIGWVAPHISSEIIHPSGPYFDLKIINKTAHAHENGDFDTVLTGYFSDAPDGAMIVAHAASITTKLQFYWPTDLGLLHHL